MEPTLATKTEEKKKGIATPESQPDVQTSLQDDLGAPAGMPLFLQLLALSSAASGVIQRQVEKSEEELLQAKQDNALVQRQPIEEVELLQPSFGEAPPVVQTKLTVCAQDDEYEREADQVAEAVMRLPDTNVAQTFEEEEGSQQSNSSPNSTPTIQPKASGEHSLSSSNQVARTIQSPSGGSPLPRHIQAKVGQVLGKDVCHVQVHSGIQANNATQSINAKAFTHQNHIYLGKGQSANDVQLMAHELTHVVQQSGSQLSKDRLQPTDALSLNQGIPLTVTETPHVRIQCYDEPEEGLSSEPRRHSGRSSAVPGVPGGTLETRIIGSRATGAPRTHLRPLSEEHSRVLERVIPGTSLYTLIRERERREEELTSIRMQIERPHALPPGGLSEEESSETIYWHQAEIQGFEQQIPSLEQEIENLDTQIQAGLSILNIEQPDELVVLVTEEFPQLFEERAKEVADAELEHNRKIVLEEAERYGIIQREHPIMRAHSISGLLGTSEQVSQNRRALRAAAHDLIARDRQIEESRRYSEQQQLQRETSAERRFSRVGRFTRLHTGLSIHVAQLQRDRERQQQAYVLRFPILHVIEPQAIATASDRELDTVVGGEIDEILRNIETTRRNIRNNRVKIWDLPRIMERTKQDLGINSNPVLLAAINNHIQEERTNEQYLNIALAALAITAGIITTIGSGGSLAGPVTGIGLRLVAGGVGLGISTYQLSESVATYLAESAASNIALDRNLADISRREPELGRVIFDLVTLGFDSIQIIRVLPLLRPSIHALEAGRIDEFEVAVRAAFQSTDLPPAAAARCISRASRRHRIAERMRELVRSISRVFQPEAMATVEEGLRSFGQRAVADIFERFRTRDAIHELNYDTLVRKLELHRANDLRGRGYLRYRGFYDPTTRQIFISHRGRDQMIHIQSTLIHEIVHGVQHAQHVSMSTFYGEFQAYAMERIFLRRVLRTTGSQNLPNDLLEIARANDEQLMLIVAREQDISIPNLFRPERAHEAVEEILRRIEIFR